MARDTPEIGADVVIGSSTPPVETTVEALIRAYNRLPLDSDVSAGDGLEWDGAAWTPKIVPHDVVNVKGHGAVGDGTTDDTAAIQTAIDTLESGDTLYFPSGTYYVTSKLTLPKTNFGGHLNMHVVGYGASLTTDQPIVVMGRGMPVDSTEALAMNNVRWVVEGLRFGGTHTAGQVGLQMIASYGAVVRNCTFRNLDTGLELINVMMGRVEGCFSTDNVTYGYRVRSGAGLWTGATVSNAPSNMTRLESCRDYGRAGMTAQFSVEGSGGVVLTSCITEGGNPVDNVVFDSQSTTTFELVVRDHWSENTPTNAIFRIVTNYKFALDGLHAVSGVTIVDASGMGKTSQVTVKNLPWLDADATFRHAAAAGEGPQWHFENIGDDVSVLNAGRWDDVVPKFLLQVGFHENSNGRNPWIAFPSIAYLGDQTGGLATLYLNTQAALGEQPGGGLALPNDARLYGLNAAGSAVRQMVRMTTGDVIQLGSGATQLTGTSIGFFGATPAVQPELTYSRGSETTAEAQLRQALAALGLVTDATTA